MATHKHATFEGAKLLLVQPVTIDDEPRGTALLAVDSVGAGVHETYTDSGKSQTEEASAEPAKH